MRLPLTTERWRCPKTCRVNDSVPKYTRGVVAARGEVMTAIKHLYEIRPRKDKRGVDLISDALPFGGLWYGEPNAIGYAKHLSRSHDAVIRVYDAAGNVIETHEHAGEFKGP